MELREQLELLKEQNTRQDRERFPSFGEDSFVSGSSHEEIQHLKAIIDKLQAEKKALTKKVCRIENLTVMIIMTNIYNAASSCYCFPCYIFCLALHFLFEFVHTRNTKAVNTQNTNCTNTDPSSIPSNVIGKIPISRMFCSKGCAKIKDTCNLQTLQNLQCYLVASHVVLVQCLILSKFSYLYFYYCMLTMYLSNFSTVLLLVKHNNQCVHNVLVDSCLFIRVRRKIFTKNLIITSTNWPHYIQHTPRE